MAIVRSKIKYQKSKIKIKQLAISYWLFAVIICGLSTVNCKLSFAQDKDDHLTTKKNIEADYISFTGDRANWPTAPLEGEIFYNSTEKLLKYFDGTQWQGLGSASGPKTVASKIVAASNSLDKTAADYVCDGIDDQVEIQQAIDALGTIGGAVYLLEGTYNISGSINMANNVSLIGSGAATVLRAVNSNIVILASSVSNILISQLRVNGDNKTETGIRFSSVTNSKINNSWMEYMAYVGTHVPSGAIELRDSSKNNIITENNITNIADGSGILIMSSFLNIISGNQISVNDADSVGITVNFAGADNNIISGNNIRTGFCSIHLSGSNSTHNNIIYGNILQGSSMYALAFGNSGLGTIVSSNIIQQAGREGMRLDYANASVVQGNVINSTGYEAINLFVSRYNVISGNSIFESGREGIQLDLGGLGSNDNNIVSSNQIYKSGAQTAYYGIDIVDGVSNYLVNNYVSGTGYAGFIKDSASNTKYTDKSKITLEKKQITVSTATYTLDMATIPKSYISLVPTVDTTLTLANGKSAGDLVIIENGTGTGKNIIINEASNSVSLESASISLGAADVLELIWNGTKWLEIKYTNNI